MEQARGEAREERSEGGASKGSGKGREVGGWSEQGEHETHAHLKVGPRSHRLSQRLGVEFCTRPLRGPSWNPQVESGRPSTRVGGTVRVRASSSVWFWC